MELVSHFVPVRTRQQDTFLLMPLGDIQYAGENRHVALGMLKRHVQWGVDQGAYFLGMGDYIDFASPSNRQRLSQAALYDTANTVIGAKADELVEELYEEALKPSRGRWLGLLEGHHFYQHPSGITTDQKLAGMLKAKFLGTSACIRLQFNRGGSSHPYVIWCHHGTGGGATAAAVLNKLQRMSQGFAADLFLMGHLPRKVNEPMDYLVPVYPNRGTPHLAHRTKIFAGTGGFMKSWVPQSTQGGIPRGGYAEQKMLPPAALGGILVRIRPRWVKIPGGGPEMWLPDASVES